MTSSDDCSHPASAAARCVSSPTFLVRLSHRSRPPATQARYVHQDCLRSWREADKLNSFYACGQCGERYRFRKTRVTALLGNRRTSDLVFVLRLPGTTDQSLRTVANLIIATTMLLLVAFVAGFAADPLLRLADVDVLDPKTGELIRALSLSLRDKANRVDRRLAAVLPYSDPMAWVTPSTKSARPRAGFLTNARRRALASS